MTTTTAKKGRPRRAKHVAGERIAFRLTTAELREVETATAAANRAATAVNLTSTDMTPSMFARTLLLEWARGGVRVLRRRRG